jgi:GrpB-like predicted nucleotidyltransferase (UPF0157 family)
MTAVAGVLEGLILIPVPGQAGPLPPGLLTVALAIGWPAVIAEDDLVNIPAVVVTYDPQWPRQFERLRSQVDTALASVEHVTVHIGSTAVPGLDAKPIIDLDAVVADQAAVAVVIDALAAAGWQHQGDLGVPGRDAFRPPANTIYHHLYVVTNSSQAHRDHVDLRDFLRAHPGQAARYAKLKHQLAQLLRTDRTAYATGKADLIAKLLTHARQRNS